MSGTFQDRLGQYDFDPLVIAGLDSPELCEAPEEDIINVSVMLPDFYQDERFVEIERELSDARDRLAVLEEQVLSKSVIASFVEVHDALATVKAFTTEIFGTEGTVSQQCDCEIESDRHYFVFRVIDSSGRATRLSRNKAWHRRLSEVPEATRPFFRLSTTAK